jgi:hypothetical protein
MSQLVTPDSKDIVIVDADGHVFEDRRGIVELLPEPYRGLREKELTNANGPGVSRVFPPLGYLSSIPFVVTADADRTAEETGLEPQS